MRLEETLRALYDGDVQFVLIGGAAIQLQGGSHLTEDLDFCYARTPQNLTRLARAMEPYHARLRNAPDNLPFRFDAKTIECGLNFTLSTDLGPLDFLGEVSGLGSYQAVAENSEVVSIFGLDIRVLTLEGLIKAKIAAARAKDLDVIAEMRGLLEARKKAGL